MSWIYLVLAGIMEIGWPLGFKMAQISGSRVLWVAFSVLCMAASGLFLYLAQRAIPIGTAYAVWTGIGAVGAFTMGIIFFRDPATFFRIISAGLVVAGIIGLRLSHQ
ncbi:MAG TPA: multidrug efflux SMR transporter [Spirochaetota bacterium]|nr:multidrug efflux SMR transporter [Spirochaetota bacterium]HOD13908.1 multidrug efflux SMR transporter [Spirochaetota bacterium]HPG49704.1 multidrug efflux SMR transporter [Spirochaetota bacterium]HPN12412.1 multidrug efflux SMR transporter [Spirochaetota bacterium]HQL80708.1 multidrug efflux SMR transporter [Spirochaetota bacterium]